MPIFYALIARQQFVIADYNTSVGNAAQVALQILSKPHEGKTFRQFAISNYTFVTYLKDGFEVLGMADTNLSLSNIAAFLRKIHEEFELRFSPNIRSQLMEHPHQMPEFIPVLQQWVSKYSDSTHLSKLDQLKQQLNELERQTRENIDRKIEEATSDQELSKWTRAKQRFLTYINKPQ